MNDYRDLMVELDSDGETTLYKLENDLFDTVVAIYHEDEDDEQAYVLTDMQSAYYPMTIAEMAEYEWARAEDIDW